MPLHFRRDLSWLSVVVAFAPQTLLCASASAQSATEPPAPSAPPTQTAGQDAEARQLFDAGTVAFREGRYENALDYLERAYELSPRPALLFNIGTTLERLQRDEDAVVAYERYLAEEPEAANRADVESRMRHLRAAIADRSVSRPPPPTASPDPTPWVLVGSGALVVIAGAVLTGLWAVDASAVGGAPAGSSWSLVSGAYDRAEAEGISGAVLLGAGAALATVGLVWAVIPRGESSTVEAALLPGGAQLRGTF